MVLSPDGLIEAWLCPTCSRVQFYANPFGQKSP